MIIKEISLERFKSRDLVLLECEFCGKDFQRTKREVVQSMKPTSKNKIKYCSWACKSSAVSKEVKTKCAFCEKPITKKLAEIKKTVNTFCSRSCSCSYNNKNRKLASRENKLEKRM